MSATTETIAEIKQPDIEPLRWFIDAEAERLNEMRRNIADNWHLLTTFEVADFTEIVGMQGALVSLSSLLDANASNAEIRDEWERMASRKLRQFNFVPSNSSQAANNARGYEGAFWARAIDKLELVR